MTTENSSDKKDAKEGEESLLKDKDKENKDDSIKNYNTKRNILLQFIGKIRKF